MSNNEDSLNMNEVSNHMEILDIENVKYLDNNQLMELEYYKEIQSLKKAVTQKEERINYLNLRMQILEELLIKKHAIEKQESYGNYYKFDKAANIDKLERLDKLNDKNAKNFYGENDNDNADDNEEEFFRNMLLQNQTKTKEMGKEDAIGMNNPQNMQKILQNMPNMQSMQNMQSIAQASNIQLESEKIIKELLNPQPPKRFYSLEFKYNALEVFESCNNKTAAARRLGMPKKTLRNWIENSEKIRNKFLRKKRSALNLLDDQSFKQYINYQKLFDNTGMDQVLMSQKERGIYEENQYGLLR